MGYFMDLERAEQFWREALDVRQRTTGPDDPKTMAAKMSLASPPARDLVSIESLVGGPTTRRSDPFWTDPLQFR